MSEEHRRKERKEVSKEPRKLEEAYRVSEHRVKGAGRGEALETERRRKRKRKLGDEPAKNKPERQRDNTGEADWSVEKDSAAERSNDGNKKEKKDNDHKKEMKEKKKKKDRSNKKTSVDSGNRKNGIKKEQVQNSQLSAEQASSKQSEGDAKKTKKKKEKVVGISGEIHISDSINENQVEASGGMVELENVGTKSAARHKREGANVMMSKKEKWNGKDNETGASNSTGVQTVSNEDKKRMRKEYTVTIQESRQIGMSKVSEKREDEKKRRRKERDNIRLMVSQNASTGEEGGAGDGKNDKKKKRSKEEGRGVGIREKKKAGLSKEKGRRVSFADNVQVFHINGGDEEDDGSSEPELVHGIRFAPEEDAALMEAIKKYAEMKQLGEKGSEMIRASGKHPELKGCWADIAKSLPHRPIKAIYKRARILLDRSDQRNWTEEEKERIRQFVATHGTEWKTLAKELGKSEIHVKDTWRRIKLKNLKTGAWTQDEYQHLFDLVNLDLRVKAHQEANPGHRLLRDNISWEAISDKLTTRNHKNCCIKWYGQLSSSLVKQGKWADVDDYRLIEALQKVDAVCVEDVDWDSLLDHRSGEFCRQRWNQMIRNIGGHRERPFIDQVEVLSKRYCPEMLEYREEVQ